MANKLAQITVGDLRVIHLDANPITDTIGYHAEKGSIAVFQNGSNSPLLFIKKSAKGVNPTEWVQFVTSDEAHQVTGNVYTNALPALLGSLLGSTNLDLHIVRNSVAQIKILEDAGDYRESKLVFLEDLEIRQHITNNNQNFNQAYNIQTGRNLVISSNATMLKGEQFVALGFKPLINGYVNAEAYELRKGTSLKAIFNTIPFTLIIVNEEENLVSGDLKKIRVTMVGRHSSNHENSNFISIKELSVRVDQTTGEHFILFQQDNFTFNQDDLPRNFIYQFDSATKKQLQAVMTGHSTIDEMEISVSVEELGFQLSN